VQITAPAHPAASMLLVTRKRVQQPNTRFLRSSRPYHSRANRVSRARVKSAKGMTRNNRFTAVVGWAIWCSSSHHEIRRG
jgi:hypothetical protein